MLKVGDMCPNFSLLGINAKGEEENYSKDSLMAENKALVIYFYPKDNTPGCTKESCNFNLALSQIQQIANIVGVSADDIKSHKNFQEKYGLKFPLLCDTNYKMAEAFASLKGSLMATLSLNKIARSTFLINKESIITNVWYSVKVDGHDKEILEALKLLS